VYRDSETDTDNFILEGKFEIPYKKKNTRIKGNERKQALTNRMKPHLLEQESISQLYEKRANEKLKHITQDVENDWQNVKEVVLTAAKESLVYISVKAMNWIITLIRI
jgi:hypothetical protein